MTVVAQEAGDKADLQLQVMQSQYLSETQNSNQTGSYSSLGVRFRFESDPVRNQYFGADFLALASMDGTEQGYVALPELYAGIQSGVDSKNRVSLSVGRRRFNWSEFDDEWRLGIWQSYVRWDYLHPRPQGLVGAFLDVQQKETEITLFASPLFLPDQGPQFDVEDGQFTSSNRWFRQPSSRHTVLNQDRRLNYDLDRPAEKDIVLHSAFGLSIRIGPKSNGVWLKTSIANKPISQLHLGIEGYHSIARENRYLESMAIVHPTVARHTVTTVEAGLNEDDYRAWVSLTEERPDDPDLPDDWEEASLYPSRFFGVSFSHRLPFQGFRSQWVKYSYMTMFEDVPNGPESGRQDTLESSLDRYPFKEVIGAEWTAPVIQRARRRLDFGFRYLYSIPERGALLSAKMELLWDRQTRFDLGVDILGAESDIDDPDAGLMSLYRNNDRVMGGLTYVF